MIQRYKDLSKETFGRVKPIRKIGTKHDCALWLCRCYCGNIFESTSGELTRTRKPRVSCGSCYDHKKYPKEYAVWKHMEQRCYDPNCKDYPNYGGRGITVHREWRLNFLKFLEHIGFRPEGDFTIDRRNNDGNYEPGNVRWTDRWTQNLNKRNTK